ncbi:hypothetical protein ZIOFF_016550 [Zingiber officinale]|uniref:Retroviral polymerase SH3-like domain-containing protein n=1 Tax=Zingiber officinale TaxID=94328 RepID=A0A8J5LVE8_ZINOF|nr:hypothetical protein ZIOFF_016550 [Zingiber officinale]
MESYLQGQDLWEVVGGSEATQPTEDANSILRKWKIKAGKAMFALKITIEEEILEHIRDAKTPKEVKLICREISELDPSAPIGEARIKRIIIHGLRPEYRGFIAAIQGWPTQPSLLEFENLLAGQEAMANQMGGLSLKDEEEAFYTNKNKGNFKRHTGGSKKDGDKGKSYHGNGGSRPGGASKNYGDRKKISGECYNCGKFDKKAIRCIFVGYDSQRNGWKCCDPTSERCYTSRNVVFDEASSWWTTEKEVLPESKDLEDKVQQKMREHIVQLQSGSDESGGLNDNDAEQRVAQSPWQTSIYQHPNEEERPNEVEELTPQSQLRRFVHKRLERQQIQKSNRLLEQSGSRQLLAPSHQQAKQQQAITRLPPPERRRSGWCRLQLLALVVGLEEELAAGAVPRRIVRFQQV